MVKITRIKKELYVHRGLLKGTRTTVRFWSVAPLAAYSNVEKSQRTTVRFKSSCGVYRLPAA